MPKKEKQAHGVLSQPVSLTFTAGETAHNDPDVLDNGDSLGRSIDRGRGVWNV
jgi:hypothetical protein